MQLGSFSTVHAENKKVERPTNFMCNELMTENPLSAPFVPKLVVNDIVKIFNGMYSYDTTVLLKTLLLFVRLSFIIVFKSFEVFYFFIYKKIKGLARVLFRLAVSRHGLLPNN